MGHCEAMGLIPGLVQWVKGSGVAAAAGHNWVLMDTSQIYFLWATAETPKLSIPVSWTHFTQKFCPHFSTEIFPPIPMSSINKLGHYFLVLVLFDISVVMVELITLSLLGPVYWSIFSVSFASSSSFCNFLIGIPKFSPVIPSLSLLISNESSVCPTILNNHLHAWGS